MFVVEKDDEYGVDESNEDDWKTHYDNPGEQPFTFNDLGNACDNCGNNEACDDPGHEYDDDASFRLSGNGCNHVLRVEVDIAVADNDHDQADCDQELHCSENHGM